MTISRVSSSICHKARLRGLSLNREKTYKDEEERKQNKQKKEKEEANEKPKTFPTQKGKEIF